MHLPAIPYAAQAPSTATGRATAPPARQPVQRRARRRALLPLAGLGLFLGGCADVQPLRAIHIASASTSHALCSQVFITGRDPAVAYAQEMRPERGMGLLDWALRHSVDASRGTVTTRIGGLFEQRAVFLPGEGCREAHDDATFARLLGARAMPQAQASWAPAPDAAPAASPALPAIAPDAVVPASDPRVRAAIDAAFADAPGQPPANTLAVVVVHRGRVIGERYAPGIGLRTPLHGHSVSKTFTQALVGALALHGRLPGGGMRATLPAWQHTGDARAQVTIEQLLRMTSGLGWDEYAGGFDPASRMWHREDDQAAFAANATLADAPGARWHYSNRGYQLVSGLLRDTLGGADGVRAFARTALADPLGMRDLVIESDLAGTPGGASQVFASARDWARFGLLYLGNGVAGGRRLLPEGWVARVTTPSPGTGYGAGFWLNNSHARNEMSGDWGLPDAPADAYFARGYLGQFVVMVPSAELVVVRMAVNHGRAGDAPGMGRLVGAVVAACGDGVRGCQAP